jgi:hypothetical protein
LQDIFSLIFSLFLSEPELDMVVSVHGEQSLALPF